MDEADRRKMYNNLHKVKSLKKKCPECCVGELSIVEYSIYKDGVTYFEEFEECSICEYSVKIKLKRKGKEDDLEYGW